MTLQALVADVLSKNPATRSSDKFLIFSVWRRMGLVKKDTISYTSFKKAPSIESILRSKRTAVKANKSLKIVSKRPRATPHVYNFA